MATIKVFSSIGVKELQCFDNYDEVDFDTGYEDGTELLPDFNIEEE